MKTFSIELDDATAAWVDASAARDGVDGSRFVSTVLRNCMLDARGYEAAYREFRNFKPLNLRRAGEPLPSRDDANRRR